MKAWGEGQPSQSTAFPAPCRCDWCVFDLEFAVLELVCYTRRQENKSNSPLQSHAITQTTVKSAPLHRDGDLRNEVPRVAADDGGAQDHVAALLAH